MTIRRSTLTAALGALVAGAALLSGCAAQDPPPPPLMLSGPTTNVVAAIPPGWHQVINSAQPLIPEMVTPVDCMGPDEAACATGLARIATTTAPSVEAAVGAVTEAVVGEPGVTPGPTVSQGPGPVGLRDGYRHRFVFTNARGRQTAEVSAVASGPTTPDAQGRREFSVVLAWVVDRPGSAPGPVLDGIVGSVLVHGGETRR